MDGMDDIVKEFIVESNDNLDQLDRDLVSLEQDPTSKDLLGGIFRAIHTIKGTTGFLGFSKLESVAHAGESLLSRLRDGVFTLTPEITSGLLVMVDSVRSMLASIETSGNDGVDDYFSVIQTLTRLQGSEGAKAAQCPGDPAEEKKLKSRRTRKSKQPAPAMATAPQSERVAIGEILEDAGKVTGEHVSAAFDQQMCGDPRHLGEILVSKGSVTPGDVLDALQTQKEIHSPALSSSNIRVDVDQLDKLMNLVGELVLARNQILQFSTSQKDSTFLNTTQRLNLITTELQEGVMKTRMQPIDNVWNKFPRVVRDLSLSCGKQVRVEMEGKETELDKTIIEAIKDPLTHVVRNSIDHGIEPPEVRVAAGKPAEARLFLSAFHEGGQVNIDVSDDGSGIDLERVKRKAIERGLVTPEQAARMSEREAVNLIFLPGFSTAEKVTNVSGRGVGMDVVKTNIEKIGGTVDVQSTTGAGTTIKIKIPLTLAIIPALVVTSGGDRYAIPQISLLELVRLEGGEAAKGIETIHGAPVYRLRGNLLPLVYLNQELGLDPAKDGAPAKRDVANIVVLQADDHQFGLLVDEVNDTEEIVVKPLGKHLKGIPIFAGATIMGDGKVALILDVLGLAHRANVISEASEHLLKEEAASPDADSGAERQTLLLFLAKDDGRMAIPLSLVTRLEEFPRGSIELAGDQPVVQYRKTILPLVHVSSLVPERRHEPRHQATEPSIPQSDKVQVVVHTNGGRSVGLIVERILDIVEENVAEEQPPSREGVKGSLVIQGRVTEILDLERLMRSHEGFVERPLEPAGARS